MRPGFKSKSNTLRQWLLYMALTACYGGASMLMFTVGFEELTGPSAAVRFVLVGGGLAMLGVLCFLGRQRVQYRRGTFLILASWLLFGAACVVAAVVVNDTMYNMLTQCWLFLGIPFFFFYLFPRTEINYTHLANINAVVTVAAGYLLYSFIKEPNFKFLYKGVFGHQNQVGLLGSLLSVGCLSIILFSGKMENKIPRFRKYMLAFLLGMGIFAIFLSGSRTSLIAFTATLAVAVVYMQPKIRRIVLSIVGVLAISLGLMLSDSHTGISWIDSFIQKHQEKSRSGETLSGRETIWAMIIEDASLMGHGSTYFANNVGISAHNSFLNVLGRRGMIACVLLIGFCLISIVKTFGFAKKISRHQPTAIASMLLIIHFWCLSMAEATLGNIGTVVSLSFYAAVGALLVNPIQKKMYSPYPGYRIVVSHAPRQPLVTRV